jgi:hypothetical protein
MQMQLGSDIQIRDGLLAEMTLLREKPRLGFGHAESTVHQGLKAANYLNHVRDTTTVVRYSWQMSLIGPTTEHEFECDNQSKCSG